MSKKRIIEQIEELPLYDDSKKLYIEDGGEIVEQESFKPVTEIDSDQAVSIVSKRYTLQQHKDAFKKVLEHMPDDIKGKVMNYKTKAAMSIYPEGKDIGIWVMNSVDTSAAVRVNFTKKEDFGEVYIPSDAIGNVAEYKRVHRGKWKQEYENFLETIEQVQSAWTAIVEKMSAKEAKDEDIELIKESISNHSATEIESWLAQTELRENGSVKKRKPSLWDIVVRAIKEESKRLSESNRVASELTMKERVRKISSSILAYALKQS